VKHDVDIQIDIIVKIHAFGKLRFFPLFVRLGKSWQLVVPLLGQGALHQ